MFIRAIAIDIHIPGARTLKDKRQVLQSIIVRLRRLNLSVAEVGYQDQWQRAALGVAMVGADLGLLEQLQAQILRLIEESYPVEIAHWEIRDYE
ncbi:hypothetical protein EDC14_1006126 [Hydrogenispora ethanolica]|jgi:uncharacterized protein YlxP (DUF503 family)|uniref:DUF503 domain-containing protein n=1 Tax=Hydrogenispora ethanolica TaxID=1082276 RepID=A0A4R1RZZ7_HYDET|nr:DUF503 domain-containing protein [Hydrogenispora ethanolica]TCL72413.1 hypothetical protein EDC14_1006126 [Hydrogenispora ethanolica]